MSHGTFTWRPEPPPEDFFLAAFSAFDDLALDDFDDLPPGPLGIDGHSLSWSGTAAEFGGAGSVAGS
ncbi:hypothetical protein [Rhodococcus rhodnii]|uniref:Uncharacterized protein n=1 Tax=Rhodococcus rhodnii LMG 5362 TaxID=1273125 RepID=R7WLP4_9NOCA|nr:hypothetical protein [Rhodococcus rhodnii]EOM74919.1 hypothetical protein Rrhod_3797 [Rhodococcus rhodnii LMG 5362]